jgi:hypothetical protein
MCVFAGSYAHVVLRLQRHDGRVQVRAGLGKRLRRGLVAVEKGVHVGVVDAGERPRWKRGQQV